MVLIRKEVTHYQIAMTDGNSSYGDDQDGSNPIHQTVPNLPSLICSTLFGTPSDSGTDQEGSNPEPQSQ